MTEPCKCGDPWCPSCGSAMGTYRERDEPDPDAAYDRERQKEIDDAT